MSEILHVDDSNFQRRIAKKIIMEVFPEYNITSLSDIETFEKFNNNEDFSKYDILISDLLMDKISGHDVIKKLREVNADCCISVLSSNIQASEKKLCFENGADYFIEKPLTHEKIIEFREFYNDRV